MANMNLRRFSKPSLLREIDQQYLSSFLKPFESYFLSHGVSLDLDAGQPLDVEALCRIFMTPTQATPDDLIEALFYVSEVSTPEGFDSLLEELESNNIELDYDDNTTPTELVILAWMKDRSIIEKVHAQQFFTNMRSFDYFKCQANPLPEFVLPLQETISRLEAYLDEWFSKKRRGQFSKVFFYPKEEVIWFLVRHGKPFVRESTIEDGQSSSVYFRPEKFDVLAYNRAIGEIMINAETKGERELYRKAFGLYLFHNEEFFNQRSRFDLEPLRQYGEDALACHDVPGIQQIKLKEIQIAFGGAYKDFEVYKSDNLFASLRDRQQTLPEGGKIVKASFLIQFTGSKVYRSVTVNAGNRAQFKRDSDALVIEQWLALRGFINGAQGTSL